MEGLNSYKINNEESSEDTERGTSEDKFIEEGSIDAKPFLDGSDGGTLDKHSPNQQSVIVIGFLVLVVAFIILNKIVSPFLKAIFSKSNSLSTGQINQNSSVHRDVGVGSDASSDVDSDACADE